MYAWYNDNCLDDVVEIEHTLMYVDDIYIYIYINIYIYIYPFDLKFRSLYQKRKGDIIVLNRELKDQLKLIVQSNSDC